MGERRRQRQTGLGYARSMSTTDLLDEWLPSLQHPAVRDLAWTLLAAPLLATPPCPQRHPLSASDWLRQPGRLADWLRRQDQAPQALLDWLARRGSQRLGIHYEQLWQFALQQAPGIQLLGANLPVRLAGQTLGELDLLLRDDAGVHHLELAVKLYLGPTTGAGEQPANWCGAGQGDTLQRKLQHLQRQQLPLSASAAARPLLASLASGPVLAGLWMSGYLFYPWPAGCASPAGNHPRHARGHWLLHRELPAFLAASPAQHWQPVPRDCRLAPLANAPSHCWSRTQLAAWQQSLAVDGPPCLLAGFARQADGRWHESSRVMLLNDHWPQGPAHTR